MIWPERSNHACSSPRPNYACNCSRPDCACNRVPGAWLRYCVSPRPINVLGDGNSPVYYPSRDRIRHQAQVDRRATAAVRRRSAPPYAPARRVSFSESLCEKPRIANRIPTDNPSRAPSRRTSPTSPRNRASTMERVPTAPAFHTATRLIMRRSIQNLALHFAMGDNFWRALKCLT